MTLYMKDGCEPQPLPDADKRLEDGFLLMPLEGYSESIEACGWIEAPPPPMFDPLTQQLGWDGSAWKVEPISAERRAAYLKGVSSAIDARAQLAFLAGFPPPHPAFAGKRLQVRNNEDRTNWLTSQASYAAAVAAGFGDVVDADFRTADNTTVTVSYGDGLQVLLAMAAWGKSILGRSWALKDAAAAGDAYDIEAGWPE